MQEYKGFKYQKNERGGWVLILPSGAKLNPPEQTEAELKAQIDALVDQAQ